MEKVEQLYNSLISYFTANYVTLIIAVLFYIIAFTAINFIKLKLRNQLIKKSRNPITATFTSQIVSFGLKFMAFMITLTLLGLNDITNKILAGAGILSFVIGFAFKDIGENFLAGIILAFKSPFRIDDLIETGKIIGHVKDINIRETLIKTPDGKDVFLPNSIILKEPLFNYTLDGFLRYEFTVGIDYKNDIFKATQIILTEVNSIDGILKGDKKAEVLIEELGTDTVNIKTRFWINTLKSKRRSNHLNIRSLAINSSVKALIENGYYLPSNVVEIKNYPKVNDESK
ncbi:MAG: mechanosensitive ion channel family protein [Cyclobacteriaceae bacterium]